MRMGRFGAWGTGWCRSSRLNDDERLTGDPLPSHIDTAWLWPFSATQQKCARSWSTQVSSSASSAERFD